MAVSVNETAGTVVFDGEPEVFYMAVCGDCEMRMPFASSGERDGWANAHGTSGHEVMRALEVRP